jgi:hypothetical protein
MSQQAQTRWDLLLLVSLLLVILIYPLLDHGDFRRLILGLLLFLPVGLATMKLSQLKGRLGPSVLLMSCAFVLEVARIILRSHQMGGTCRIRPQCRSPVWLSQESSFRHQRPPVYRS